MKELLYEKMFIIIICLFFLIYITVKKKKYKLFNLYKKLKYGFFLIDIIPEFNDTLINNIDNISKTKKLSQNFFNNISKFLSKIFHKKCFIINPSLYLNNIFVNEFDKITMESLYLEKINFFKNFITYSEHNKNKCQLNLKNNSNYLCKFCKKYIVHKLPIILNLFIFLDDYYKGIIFIDKNNKLQSMPIYYKYMIVINSLNTRYFIPYEKNKKILKLKILVVI